MKIRYITIEREYGSGGTRIAADTAARCGISCWGREVLEAVADKEKVPVDTLEDYEEQCSNSLLYSMFVMSQSQTGDPDLLSGEAKLYVAEARVIRDLALQGPAIFVGHCASRVLEDMPGVLRVYIHADEEFKRRRAIQDYGIPEKDVSGVCRRFNKKRANYYQFCTKKRWEDLKNYDLVLDSSTLSLEGCADVLERLYRGTGN